MGKARGTRIREEYTKNHDGVEISPNGSYIRLSDWSLDVPTFIELAENGYLLPNKNPKDKCKGRRFGKHDGEQFKVNGLRLTTFRLKGTTCVECGVVGDTFYLEKPVAKEPFHLNLYGYKDGKEVMITQDHIRPKARGGKDHIDNSQTMCKICNETKGHTWAFDLYEGQIYYILTDKFEIETLECLEVLHGGYRIKNEFGTIDTVSKDDIHRWCHIHRLALSYPDAEECLRKHYHAEIKKCGIMIDTYGRYISASNKRVNEYHLKKKQDKKKKEEEELAKV